MTEEKSASDDAVAMTSKTTSSAPKQQSSAGETTVVPLVFGGAIACVLGFFGGQIDSVEARLGLNGHDDLVELVDRQAETLDKQAATIEALTSRLDGVEAIELPEVDLSSVSMLDVTVALALENAIEESLEAGKVYFGSPADDARKKYREMASLKILPQVIEGLNP